MSQFSREKKKVKKQTFLYVKECLDGATLKYY